MGATKTMTRLLLPVPEAAAALGIGRSKIYELIAAGEIHTVQIGRRRLVPQEELERYARDLAEPAHRGDAG